MSYQKKNYLNLIGANKEVRLLNPYFYHSSGGFSAWSVIFLAAKVMKMFPIIDEAKRTTRQKLSRKRYLFKTLNQRTLALVSLYYVWS